MVATYNECLAELKSYYNLRQKIQAGKLYRIENGIYSTTPYPNDLSVILKKYPNTILTGDYAFYYHNLTDVIPEKYHLATKQKAARLRDPRVIQVYQRDDLLSLGAIETEIDGIPMKIYDKERMLIELLRNKNIMPYDLYKEIVGNYRKIIQDLEIWRIQEYASVFPKSKMINKALEEEIF